MPTEHTVVVVSVSAEADEQTQMQHVNAQVGEGWRVRSVTPLSGGGTGPGGESEDFVRLQVILEREIDEQNVVVRGRRDDVLIGGVPRPRSCWGGAERPTGSETRTPVKMGSATPVFLCPFPSFKRLTEPSPAGPLRRVEWERPPVASVRVLVGFTFPARTRASSDKRTEP